MMRYYSECILIQSRPMNIGGDRWRRVFLAGRERSGRLRFPSFSASRKTRNAWNGPFVGSNEGTRALRCSRMDGRDERSAPRASEDTHKRYLEFLRGFSRKYFRPIVPRSAFTTSYVPPAAGDAAPPSEDRRGSRAAY